MARSGLPVAGRRQQFPVFAVDARDMGDHFQQADDRQAGGIHHRLDPRRAQARPGAAEEFRIRPNAAAIPRTTSEAYRSPEASPAETRIFRGI